MTLLVYLCFMLIFLKGGLLETVDNWIASDHYQKEVLMAVLCQVVN